jgi:hypothetical protein
VAKVVVLSDNVKITYFVVYPKLVSTLSLSVLTIYAIWSTNLFFLTTS